MIRKTSLKYLLILTAFLGSCQELDIQELPEPEPITPLPMIGSERFIEFEIGGTSYRYANTYDSAGIGVDSVNYGACSGVAFGELKGQQFYAGTLTDSANKAVIIIEERKCAYAFNDSISQDSMFIPGVYSFSLGQADGIVVTWIDETGEIWSSELAPDPDDHNSSQFTFEERTPNPDGISAYVVSGNFQCKVFNAAGKNRTIESGTFVSGAGRYR
jgi:hypothetical protein